MPDNIRLGIRFDRRDVQLLERLADRVKVRDLTGDTQTFEHAAIAARTGEPLIVQCSHPDEVHQMAAMYATLGCNRPTVEALSS